MRERCSGNFCDPGVVLQEYSWNAWSRLMYYYGNYVFRSGVANKSGSFRDLSIAKFFNLINIKLL